MPEQLVYTLDQAKSQIGCGFTKLYELMGAGLLDARKQGSRTVVTAASLKAYVEGLPKANLLPSKRERDKANAA